MALVADFKTTLKPVWCPGCGHFTVLDALYKALAELDIPQDKLVMVSGIGCSSRLPGYVKAYGFHSVHGRALPVAMGIKTANPELTVVVVGGDGDGFSIGGGHIPHAARRNLDITYVVMDNSIYGLTKGQVSPTSTTGIKTKTSPYGSVEANLDPVTLSLAYGASYVARSYSTKVQHLKEMIIGGMNHNGFSIVQALSPCITFNNTFLDLNAKVKILENHDPSNKEEAFRLANLQDEIKLGLFYKERRETFQEEVKRIKDDAKKASLEKLLSTFEY